MSKRTTVQVTVINKALAAALKVKPGDRVPVEMKNGVPVSRYWRNRFADAPRDGCVGVPAVKKTPAKKTTTNKEG